MALELQPSINISSCCDQVQFCDLTCVFDPVNPGDCCDGYGTEGNIEKNEVIETRFNWIFPDGISYTGVDVGFVPAHYATVQFDITGGTAGDGIVVMINGVTLGTAIYTLSTPQVREDIVNSINLLSPTTHWRAYTTGDTVFLVSTVSGTEYNNLTLSVFDTPSSTFTITITSDQTTGANDSTDCYTFILPDLAGGTCPGPDYPNWPVGVYTLTYIILDNNGSEIKRKTIKFLNDCSVRNCICNATRQLLDGCTCKDGDGWEKVAILRAELDAANQAFNEGSYTCANESVQDLQARCKHLCLDC